MLEELIDFLKAEFKISQEAIFLAQKQQELEPNILPIVLWRYGLLNREQLDIIFDWLEVT